MTDNTRFYEKHGGPARYYKTVINAACGERIAGSMENVKSIQLSSGVYLVLGGKIIHPVLREERPVVPPWSDTP